MVLSPESADRACEMGVLMDSVFSGSSQVLDYQREFEYFHGLLLK